VFRSGSAGLGFYQIGSLRFRFPVCTHCPFKAANPRIILGRLSWRPRHLLATADEVIE
jgi:hypothetical protein